MERITLNAVVFREDGVWLAQCLEYNLVSCAETKDALPGELLRQIRSQITADLEAGVTPFAGFQRAPQKYWDMFERAKRHSAPMKPRKGVLHRFKELLDRMTVDAQLFPVPAPS